MRSLSETARVGLSWSPVNFFSRDFELRAGEEVLARVVKHNLLTDAAEAIASDGHWTFRRDWLLGQRAMARAQDAAEDAATLDRDWLGEGVLHMAGGDRYLWKRRDVWGARWALTRENGEALLEFVPRSLLPQAGHDLAITPAGAALPELSLVTLLCAYACALKAQEGMAGG